MRPGSAAWGVFFVALGLGAAILVAAAGDRRERWRALELAPMAIESRLAAGEIPVFPPSSSSAGIEEGEVEAGGESFHVTFQKPPRIEKVRYRYGGGRRRRGPLDDADEWFPFVAAALIACGVIGFVRTRVYRARG